LIRLVTQFDPPTARPAVATPTCCCAGCSCCCCCIVTAISASIYTAFNAQGVHRRVQAETPERVQPGSPLPGLLGFFALPGGLLAMWLVSQGLLTIGAGVLVFGLGAWFGLVGLAYRTAGHPGPWGRAAVLVALCSVAFVIEFFLWLAAASAG